MCREALVAWRNVRPTITGGSQVAGPDPLVLPDPNFDCTPADCQFLSGIRPYRRDTFRLEHENLQVQGVGTKFVVHNYGHGGAGITMSWGCAAQVRDLVLQHAGGAPGQVAVLGAGVMGLTAAKLLVEAGFAVRMHAASFLYTTSDVAGGQWCPSFVEHQNTPAATQQFENILRTAFTMHRDRIGQGYGVSERINYSKHPRAETSFNKVPLDVIPEPTVYEHLPFANLNQKGYGYHTLLVEPPIFLKKLRTELTGAVQLTQRTFGSAADVVALPEPIVVNCTGMGSRDVFGDTKLAPIKGQLVLVKAQPALQYLYSSDETYVFPREDHVVVGGSYEYHVWDPLDPFKALAILQMAKDVFAGHPTIQIPQQDWMLPEYH
jgi:glycine/D-amino acid oxidase-like deaminating enzyme